MNRKLRFFVTIDTIKKHFLTIKETNNGDLIVSPRGKYHSVNIQPKGEVDIDYSITTHNIIDHDSFTVHHNPNSLIGSITINRHQRIDSNQDKPEINYLLDVKHGNRIAPLYVSIGRNLTVLRLNVKKNKFQANKDDVEFRPGQSINSHICSVAYFIGIANPEVKFIIPKEFPRNVVFRNTKNFQVVIFYWSFPKPIKLRGTTIALMGTQKQGVEPIPGLELHEVLNLTSDITLEHARRYSAFPSLPSIKFQYNIKLIYVAS